MIRTRSGSEVLQVFWLDSDNDTAGCLVRDGKLMVWADSFENVEELRAAPGELEQAAQIVIRGGTVARAAGRKRTIIGA